MPVPDPQPQPQPQPQPRPISFAELLASGRGPRRSRKPLDPSKLDLGSLLAERDRVASRGGARRPPITRVIPVPRAIALGGQTLVVSELRLRHLAELQAYLEDAAPNPLVNFPPAWADPEPETRRARLAEAWEAARSWPVRLGTDQAAEILASPEGQAFFLLLTVREHNPGFGLAEVTELLPRITPAEWRNLRRVAYAIHPAEEIADELAPDRSPRRPADWCRESARALEDHPTAYDLLAELTVGQWRNLCSGGKGFEYHADFGAAARRVREVLEAENGR